MYVEEWFTGKWLKGQSELGSMLSYFWQSLNKSWAKAEEMFDKNNSPLEVGRNKKKFIQKYVEDLLQVG